MHEKYRTEEMNQIWSEQNKYQKWWDVEEAVLESFFDLGMLSGEELEQIAQQATWSLERIKTVEQRIRHDMLAFLEVVQDNLGDLAKYVHRGLTSSDVKDTATSLLIKQSLETVLSTVEKLDAVLVRLAREHKNSRMIGRTHGVHAEPTTFGFRCLNWLCEWRRHQQRIKQLLPRVSVGKLSGAVGTYSQITPEIEKLALEKLQLSPAPASTQILQRDRHAELVAVLANMGGTVEKMAVEVRNLQRTEIRELEERFSHTQKGSSAMPHKRNPIVAERLSGQARCLRGYAQAAFETEALWHERDLSNSSTERIVLPDAFSLLHYMLLKLTELFDKLRVNKKQMNKNLQATGGLIYSQAVLVKLMENGWPRKKAYEVVQKLAAEAWNNDENFEQKIRNNQLITEELSAAEIDSCFSPDSFLHHIPEIYQRVLKEEN